MKYHRTSLFTLITLITLVITPAAVAEIYKCDGPDGPIYSDKKCGSDAANVEIRESSGLSGVTEQDKSKLAEKKLERQQANLERQQTLNRDQQATTVDDQSNAYPTENPGHWVDGQYRRRDRINANTLPAKTRPPSKPKPVTLPARQRPAVSPKKRR